MTGNPRGHGRVVVLVTPSQAITRLERTPGIISVRAISSHGIALTAGPSEHEALLESACRWLDTASPGSEAPISSSRVYLSKRTVVVERTDSGWVVAALMVSGHKVGKSIQRAIHMAFRAEGDKSEASDRPVQPRRRAHVIDVQPREHKPVPLAKRVASPTDTGPRVIDFGPTRATSDEAYVPTRRLAERDDEDGMVWTLRR